MSDRYIDSAINKMSLQDHKSILKILIANGDHSSDKITEISNKTHIKLNKLSEKSYNDIKILCDYYNIKNNKQ